MKSKGLAELYTLPQPSASSRRSATNCGEARVGRAAVSVHRMAQCKADGVMQPGRQGESFRPHMTCRQIAARQVRAAPLPTNGPRLHPPPRRAGTM